MRSREVVARLLRTTGALQESLCESGERGPCHIDTMMRLNVDVPFERSRVIKARAKCPELSAQCVESGLMC